MSSLPTRLEFSAGGVLARRRPGDGYEACLIATQGRTRWQLPKGVIEKGEPVEAAAEREVAEETGCRGRVLEPLEKVDFWYVAGEGAHRARIYKTVYFFLLEYVEGSTDDHDDEVDAVEWVPIDEAIERLTFDNEKRVLQKARARLAERNASA